MTARKYGPAPDVVSISDIAQMAQVSRQRAAQIMDPRLHEHAPPSTTTAAGGVWWRPDVESYLLSLGRAKTW